MSASPQTNFSNQGAFNKKSDFYTKKDSYKREWYSKSSYNSYKNGNYSSGYKNSWKYWDKNNNKNFEKYEKNNHMEDVKNSSFSKKKPEIERPVLDKQFLECLSYDTSENNYIEELAFFIKNSKRRFSCPASTDSHFSEDICQNGNEYYFQAENPICYTPMVQHAAPGPEGGAGSEVIECVLRENISSSRSGLLPTPIDIPISGMYQGVQFFPTSFQNLEFSKQQNHHHPQHEVDQNFSSFSVPPHCGPLLESELLDNCFLEDKNNINISNSIPLDYYNNCPTGPFEYYDQAENFSAEAENYYFNAGPPSFCQVENLQKNNHFCVSENINPATTFSPLTSNFGQVENVHKKFIQFNGNITWPTPPPPSYPPE